MSSGSVGLLTPVSDGSDIEIRLARTRELVTTGGRADYSEPSSRGIIYEGMTSVTGTTVVSANVSPVNSAAATILTLYNPPNSGVNAEVIRTVISFLSGTPSAGVFVYNMAWNQIITATPNNAGTAGALPISPYSGQPGKCKIFTQTALSGTTVGETLIRSIGSTFAAAMATTSSVQNITDDVRGEIVVPPSSLLTIAAPGVGTTFNLAASFIWQENPISQS